MYEMIIFPLKSIINILLQKKSIIKIQDDDLLKPRLTICQFCHLHATYSIFLNIDQVVHVSGSLLLVAEQFIEDYLKNKM